MWTSALILGSALALAQPPAEDEILSHITLNGESGRTARRVQVVDKLIGEKKWTEVIDELQRVLVEAGDDLVPLGPRHCIQARRLCHLRLAAFPAEALRRYRDRVDSQARKWLEEGIAARDTAVLRRLTDETFCSRYTDQALDLLGDLAFERGAFDEAERWWQMLALPASRKGLGPPTKDTLLFPDPQVDVAGVCAKQLLALLFSGNRADFDDEWKSYKEQHGKAIGHLAGRDGNYVEILQALTAQPDALSAPPSADSWLTFAGRGTRNFILPEAKGRLERVPQFDGDQWTVNLETGELVRKTPEESTVPEEPVLGLDASKLHFHPLVFGERVFVADARHVNAYDLTTGLRVLHYDVQGDGNEPELNLNLKQTSSASMPYLTYALTASGDRIYARLGAQSIDPRGSGKVPSFLVCLNGHPRLGKLERWIVKTPERVHAVFEGAPVVHAGRVYAAVTRVGAVQMQTAIMCLDAETGATRWQCEVCATQEVKGRFRHHLLTVAGRNIVYCSHSGAIVALDAESGQRLWAVRYPSRGPETDEGLPSPRGADSCLYAGGRLYVAPMDYDRLLCLQPDSGHVLWERPLEVVHFLGATKGMLFLNSVIGTGTGLSLQHNLRTLDAATGAPVWLKPDDGQSGLATVGRGLLAGDRVYWPTSAGLLVLDQETGELLASDRRIQGNLAAANGFLVAAGNDRMTVYLPE